VNRGQIALSPFVIEILFSLKVGLIN